MMARKTASDDDAKATPADGKAPYTVTDDGWVGGRRRKKGDTVRMTPSAARYERLLVAE